jgi:hypothetical protein
VEVPSNGGALSVGQRLTRIEDRLDRVLASMQQLALESDLRTLSMRVEVLERDGSAAARHAESSVTALDTRMVKLETALEVGKALRGNRRWMIGAVTATAGWVSLAAAGLAYVLHR